MQNYEGVITLYEHEVEEAIALYLKTKGLVGRIKSFQYSFSGGMSVKYTPKITVVLEDKN